MSMDAHVVESIDDKWTRELGSALEAIHMSMTENIRGIKWGSIEEYRAAMDRRDAAFDAEREAERCPHCGCSPLDYD